MAITTLNNRSINRSDTASADQVWTATSATASDFQAAGGIGSGQSWSEVSGSRALGTTYTNSTGLPIHVVISMHMDDGEIAEFRIGGTAMGSCQKTGGNPARMMCSMIVPNGITYGMFNTSGTTNVQHWSELS